MIFIKIKPDDTEGLKELFFDMVEARKEEKEKKFYVEWFERFQTVYIDTYSMYCKMQCVTHTAISRQIVSLAIALTKRK